jgi:hypothetical protein
MPLGRFFKRLSRPQRKRFDRLRPFAMGWICLLLPMTARFLFIPAVGTAIGKNALGTWPDSRLSCRTGWRTLAGFRFVVILAAWRCLQRAFYRSLGAYR